MTYWKVVPLSDDDSLRRLFADKSLLPVFERGSISVPCSYGTYKVKVCSVSFYQRSCDRSNEGNASNEALFFETSHRGLTIVAKRTYICSNSILGFIQELLKSSDVGPG